MSEALIAELAAKPDDVELSRVFADWLLQQGHPAGELVMVQLARLTDDSEELAAREYELIWTVLKPYMDGLLARDHMTELAWRRGVVDAIRLHHHGGEEQLELVLQRLASDPVARLVRRIEISAVQFDGAGDLEPAIHELASLAPRLPRLVELAITEGMNLGNPWIEGPIRVGDLAPIYHAYPKLEVLELGGKEYYLGALDLPALRRLAIVDMSPVDIASVAEAALPSLEVLELFSARFRVDSLDAVFRKLLDRSLPALSTLAIAAEIPQVMQYLVRAVPGSTLSRYVRVLAFRRGVVDDECVRTLVQWAPRLRALDRLEVEGRGLTPDGRRRLEQTFGRVLLVR